MLVALMYRIVTHHPFLHRYAVVIQNSGGINEFYATLMTDLIDEDCKCIY